MSRRLLIERLRIFVDQTQDAFIGHSTVAIAVTFLLYNTSDDPGLVLIWGAVTLLFAVIRFAIYRRFPKSLTDEAQARRWATLFQVITFISGCTFGALPVLFFEPDNFEITAWIVMILCGLSGGAVSTLSAHVPAYRFYSVALLSPVVIVLLTYQRYDLGVLAGLFVFMFFFFDRFARRFQAMLIQEIESRLDKDDIAQDLTSQSDILKSVMRSIPNAIAVVHRDGRFLYFNHRFKSLFEVPDHLIGTLTHDAFVAFRRERGDFDHLSEDALTEQLANWNELDEKRSPFSYERILRDGRVLRVENHPTPEGGWVRSWIDVTDDRKAAAELLEAKDRAEQYRQNLQTALDAMPAGIVIHDPDLRFEVWNKTYTDMTGLTNEEIAEWRTFENLGALQKEDVEKRDDVRSIEDYIARRKAMFTTSGSSAVTEHWIGSGIHVEIRVNPIPTGGWVCVFLDVSSRIEAAEQIENQSKRLERARDTAEQTRERIRGILHSIPVGVLVFDADRHIEFWNDKYCELTGFPADVLVERPHFEDFSRFVFEAHNRGKDMTFEEFMAYRNKTYGSEDHYIREFSFDLTQVDVQYLVSPLSDGGRINVMVDITPQKQAERAALDARDIAEEATRAKSAFLASMSHEIRTPMNGVIGMAEVLGQTRLDDDQRSILETIRESGQVLLRIIDDVLDFSKIEAGRLELEEETIDLRTLMESVVDTVAPGAGSKDIDLAVLIDPGAPRAFLGDPVRLRQILTNLAGNAIKFTEKGSVVLRAFGSDHPGDPSKKILRFEVVDTGIGVPAERLPQLFEPFLQAEADTTRRFGGTGLGLSICERLVTLMGGEIGAESMVGEGSTFFVELTVEPCAHKVEAAIDKLDLAGNQVALMGRSRQLDAMLRSLLEDAGLRVTDATLPDAAGWRERFDVLAIDGRLGPEAMATVAPRLSINPQDPTARGLWIIGADTADDRAISLPRPPRREALIRAAAIMLGKASNESLEAVAPVRSAPESVTPPDADKALAEGRLVLVVEDNATNRMVVKRQLALLGIASETAEDGVEALEMLKGKGYGLVLTDCHMPNMDGYELARRIRANEAKSGADRIPIVALTANAMVGEADRCHAAGMDDYMSKPVTLERMSATLSRWMAGGVWTAIDAPAVNEEELAGLAQKAHVPRNTPAPIDVDLLARVLGTSDPEFIVGVLGLFEPSYDELAGRMAHAIADREARDLREASHAAKGAAANACAERLRAALEALETAATEEDWPQIPDLFAAATEEAGTVTAWIRTRSATTSI
ncbi:MAG: PAS-domain containing protein [Alphaproteobacteria bacterium]|nr:PAS-domain containing protein [Alphaproteobacteria bacterium]